MSTSLNIQGATLMMAAMVAFTINDMFIKLLGSHVPFFQILFLRSIGATAVLTLLAWRAGALQLPDSRTDKVLVIARSLCEMAAAYLFLNALIHMPIANVSAILQALPLTVALGAALFLGEPVGWRRLVAIAVGLFGVLLIVRPGAEEFSVYSFYALGAVVAVTVRDLAARRLSSNVKSLSAAYVAAVLILVFSAMGAMTVDWVPLVPRDWAWLAGSVATIICGYLFSVSAMRVGEIGFVAPFRYTSLVVAMILGVLVFREWPDGLTLLGAAIVVATGLFTLWRERQYARGNS